MDCEDFKKYADIAIKFIVDYKNNIRDRRVTPEVLPGWLKNEMPTEAPYQPEPCDEILADIEKKIMPGAASPSCTELETIVLDWLGKAIGLPEQFLTYPSKDITSNEVKCTTQEQEKAPNNDNCVQKNRGGGVIQGSASECVLVCMLAARKEALVRLKKLYPFVEDVMLLSKLMAYCSKEAHSCVEKAAMIAYVKLRILETDEKNSLRGATLRQAIEQDVAMGLIPFFVSTTLGTTSCCSFDNIKEVGVVVKRFPAVWMHVDAAYAGNAFICPELRGPLNGIQYADSINMNPNKWLLTNFDCSCLWVKDQYKLTSALTVEPLYLQHSFTDAIDHRHWGVPLSRRFRSLKLMFVIRTYGIKGLQDHIRLHCDMAKKFEKLVLTDSRFEVTNDVVMGLVCFRIKNDPYNKLNKTLLELINSSGKLHMVPAMVREKFVIRFCVTYEHASEEDIEYAWKIIQELSNETLKEKQPKEILPEETNEVSKEEQKKRNELARKRSSFVRMVSDPKIYNPKIVSASSGLRHRPHLNSIEDDVERLDISECNEADEEQETCAPTPSWVSTPFSFLFNADESTRTNDVQLRFRHLATKVHFKSKRDNAKQSGSKDSSATDNKSAKEEKSPNKKKFGVLQHSSAAIQ